MHESPLRLYQDYFITDYRFGSLLTDMDTEITSHLQMSNTSSLSVSVSPLMQQDTLQAIIKGFF